MNKELNLIMAKATSKIEQQWRERTQDHWLEIKDDVTVTCTHISNVSDGQKASINGHDWGVIKTKMHKNGYPVRQLIQPANFGHMELTGHRDRILCECFTPGFIPEYVFIKGK